MIFDFAPLTTTHLWLLGGAFLALFLLVGQLLRKPSLLRPYMPRPGIYYGGTLLIGVLSLIDYFVIEDPRLRIGLLAAAFLTLIIGVIDEQLKLTAGVQLVWQFVIAFIAVSWGWTIHYVSNPWQEGIISLEQFSLGGLVLPGALLGVVWLVFLMNTMNWLDGVDGLASGVGVVALLTLGLISLLPQTQDRQTLALALVGAGSVLGFLLWNFPPARVYLGTSGSWFLGLYIGMVAIVGGGKIVTTLLVLALPVLDVLLVIFQRIWKNQWPWQGDTVHHLHHQLLRAGWRPRSIALAGIGVTALCGVAAITLQTSEKFVAFILVAAGLGIIVLALSKKAVIMKTEATGDKFEQPRLFE